jgi:hypothetical protein
MGFIKYKNYKKDLLIFMIIYLSLLVVYRKCQ